MAPEELTRPIGSGLSPRVDVYRVGATLYATLTGRPPFQGEDMCATLVAVLHESPVPVRNLNPDVSPSLAAVCERCLEKRPESRYHGPGELAAALAPVGAGRGDRP